MKAAHTTRVASGLALICAITGTQLAMAQPVSAQPVDANRLAFDIHATQMEEALTEFAQATQLQVLFQSEIVKHRAAPVVSGSLTPERALQELLADSGLRYEFVNDRTVAIRPRSEFEQVALTMAAGDEPQTPVRVAEAADSGRERSQSIDGIEEEKSGERRSAVPEVLVRGSRVLNVDAVRSADDIQPYVVFRREDIEKSGAESVQDFLSRRLTSTTTAGSPGQSPNSSSGNISSINLRGLGSNQTLILVDGHRVASVSPNGNPAQPDLNGIPLAAIERIEILPTTAAGIYGGSATGGVLNIVLKRDFSGIDVRTIYEDSFRGGGATRRVDITAGFNLEGGRTSVMFGGSYSHANGMLAGDRDFNEEARLRALANDPASFGPNVAPPLGATTNIRSTAGNLTLKGSNIPLNSRITSVPVGYAGPQSDGGQAFLQTAGQYNLDLADSAQPTGKRQSLLARPEVRSFTATVNRDFTDRVKSYVTLSGSKNVNVSNSLQTTTSISLAANAAANPFNQAIQITVPALDVGDLRTVTVESRNAVGGVIIDLGNDWRSSIDYTWNRTKFDWSFQTGYTSSLAQTAAGAGNLGVFADVNQFLIDLRQFSSQSTQPIEPIYTTMRSVALRVGGPILKLPAGAITLSALGEHRHEEFDRYVQSAGTDSFLLLPSRAQAVDSLYLELAVPVVGPSQDIPLVHSLDFQLAGRRDVFRTFGAASLFTSDLENPALPPAARNAVSSNNPTAGFSWQPLVDATYRMSYGTGFLPPAINQLVPSPAGTIAPSTITANNLRDPQRGNELLGTSGTVSQILGGSSDLQPEKSKNTSIGVVLTPRVLQGFRASVDWVRIRKTGEITSLGLLQNYINNESTIPGYLIRGAVTAGDPYGVGPITAVNNGLTNVSKTEVSAYDFALEYRFDTMRFGRFVFSSAATRNVSFKRQVNAATEEIDNLGGINVLKWRANGSLSWDFHDWSVAWNTRFYDSYWVNLNHTVNLQQGSATIPSQTYHDLFVTRRFPAAFRALDGVDLQLGIKNVFDKKPPLDIPNSSLGFFYSSLGDPRLSSYYLSVNVSF